MRPIRTLALAAALSAVALPAQAQTTLGEIGRAHV